MLRLLAVLTLLVLFGAGGCVCQPSSSQAVEFNPLNWRSNDPILSPANGPGYINGTPQDLRR